MLKPDAGSTPFVAPPQDEPAPVAPSAQAPPVPAQPFVAPPQDEPQTAPQSAASGAFMPPVQDDLSAKQAIGSVVDKAKGASRTDILDIYNQNQHILSPEQEQQMAQHYQDSLTAPVSITKVAVSAIPSATSFITSIGKAAHEVSENTLPLAATAGIPIPKNIESAKKLGAETLAGAESFADWAANLVRSGVRNISQAPDFVSAARDSAGSVQRAIASILPQSLASKLPTLPKGLPEPAKPAADIFNPSGFSKPEDAVTRLRADAALHDQTQKIASDMGYWPSVSGLDVDSLKKQGIEVSPDAVAGFSNIFGLATFEAFTGLKIAKVGDSFEVTNGAGKVMATAGTEDAAKVFVQKTADAVGAAAKKFSQGLDKVSSVVTSPLKKLKAGGAALIGAGASEAAMHAGGAGALAHSVFPAAAGALGAKLALKGLSKGTQFAAAALGSDVGSTIAAGALKGAGAAAKFTVPLAAAQPSKQEAADMMVGNSLLGGVAGATVGTGIKVAEGLQRAGQLAHAEIWNNLETPAAKSVALNVPGLDALEAEHQKNIGQLQASDPKAAAIMNAFRATLAPKDITLEEHAPISPTVSTPSYLISPEFAKSIGLPEAEGANDVTIKGSDGTSHKILAWVAGPEGVEALSHEPGHFIADYIRKADPQAAQQLLDSVPTAVKDAITNQYLQRAGNAPEIVKAAQQPGYMDNEVLAEVLGKYAEGKLQNNLPLSARQELNVTFGKVLDKLGLYRTTIAPGEAGASQAFGVLPNFSSGKLADSIVSKWMSDPTVAAALKEVHGGAGPAIEKAPVTKPGEVPMPTPAPTPTVPTAPTGQLTPEHEAVLKGIAKVMPGKAMERLNAIADKLRKNQSLTPEEADLWKGVDDAAIKAGAKPTTPTAAPEAPVVPPAKPEVPIIFTPAPAAAPGSLRTTPEDYNKFIGPARQPAMDRVSDALASVKGSKDYTPDQKQAVETLLTNLRTPHDVVYNAAKVEGGTERAPRREDIQAARGNPDLRAAASKLASIPLDARKLANGDVQIQFWSGDKVLSNIKSAVDQITQAVWKKKLSPDLQVPYEVKDAKLTPGGMTELASDLQKYTENQDNGYKGDGTKLVRPANPQGFIPDENPGYTPQPVSAERARFLNLLMGERPPKTARANAGTVPIQARAKALAGVNKHAGEVIQPAKAYKAPFQDVSISEYNPLRAKLEKAGINLSGLTEAHEWVNAKDIQSAKPRPDIKLSPSATDVTAAGFLPKLADVPEKERGPGQEVTIHRQDGTSYQAMYLGNVGGNDWVGRAAEGPKGPAVSHGLLSKTEKIVKPGELHATQFLPAKNPRAVRLAAVRTEEGKIFTGAYHADAIKNYFKESRPEISEADLEHRAWAAVDEPAYKLESGFMTNEGEFLNREQAFNRAVELKQYKPSAVDQIDHQKQLEAVSFQRQQEHPEIPPIKEAPSVKVSEGPYVVGGVRFLPKVGEPVHSEEIRGIAEEYAKGAGIDYAPRNDYAPVNEPLMKRLADHFEGTPSNLESPEVQRSYQALAKETMKQYQAIKAAGYTIEPYTGKGEPYHTSKEMLDDVRNNKHLFFLKTEGNFGGRGAVEESANPLLRKSGESAGGHPLLVNDVFRAVHDFFGHAKEGYQFGPRGEFNAWRAHSRMFSPEAQGALAAETLGQNAWVNFGPHMRNAAGELVRKGEEGHLPPAERPFAQQKNLVVPQHLLDRAHETPSPDAPALSEFQDEKTLPAALAKPDWAGMNATQEALGPHDNEANLKATDALERELKESGMPYMEVGGKYKGVEQGKGFLISPITASAAVDLGRKYKQESVITPEGLLYTDGTLSPASPEGLKVGKEAEKEDFYATQKDGPSFAMKIDHSKRLPTGLEEPPRRGGEAYLPKLTGWIEPNDKFSELQGSYHEYDIASKRAKYNEEYGTKFGPKPSLANRAEALKAGFVRVRYVPNNGELTMEVSDKHWDARKAAMLDFVLKHASSIDNLTINLIDKKNYSSDTASGAVFRAEDRKQALQDIFDQIQPNEKAAGGEPGLIRRARALPGAYLPKNQADLFGDTVPTRETDVRKMSPSQITKQFPEAIKPQLSETGNKSKVPYNFESAPLVKGLKTEDEKVAAYADKLVDEARKYESSPEFQSGLRWYSEFVPQIKSWFGKQAPLFAELLAATSPRTNPTVNFGYAVKALEGYLRGEYDDQISKFNEGLDKLADGSLEQWYNRNTPKNERPDAPQPEHFFARWLEKNELLPTQWNRFTEFGDPQEVKYGMHGERIMRVFARKWADSDKGPKVSQFLKNLTGEDHGATVDVWAARTLRRLGYDVGGKRWRILPEMEGGVSDNDFNFGQKVFAAAAEKMNVQPDALQGGMWFAEKKYWAEHGWGRLDFGDFRKELDNFISRRKLEAAQGKMGDELVPIQKVQSRATPPPSDLSDIRPVSKKTQELFDIKPKGE